MTRLSEVSSMSRSTPMNRTGRATSIKPNIQTRFPFIEDGIGHDNVMRILADAVIGLPACYEWRTRAGCYFGVLAEALDKDDDTIPCTVRCRSTYADGALNA